MKKLLSIILAIMLAFGMFTAFAAEYTDKETVKAVQTALNDAGYNCGTPDGIAGKNTANAIASYQNEKGLAATGAINDELLIALGLKEENIEEVATEEPDQLPEGFELSSGSEVWVGVKASDAPNYVVFQEDGIMTAYIDWIGKPIAFNYTKDESGYLVEGGMVSITGAGEEMKVDFFEYGTSKTYRRATEEEYIEIIVQFVANTDVSWLVGEWKLKKSSGERTGETIVINEDGTCSLYDTEYTWEIGVEGWKEYFGISLYQDGMLKYSIVGTASSEKVMLAVNSNGSLIGDAYLVK